MCPDKLQSIESITITILDYYRTFMIGVSVGCNIPHRLHNKVVNPIGIDVTVCCCQFFIVKTEQK